MKWGAILSVVAEWGPRLVRAIRGAKNEKDAEKRGDTLRKVK